ncbi:hypothetical protein M422DRAFT_39649 [Sphaerobolus stellatus SS14]|uniref:Uncharacterized protein n=1 Tax=Sphaerobolus stellatus (strain SS14) TaxID=990650 RepID=A0A0C9UD78_SPHS4|nr:hypothetical protein M422DRAFT_39649 [Sphaerobolus stellatus SS14]
MDDLGETIEDEPNHVWLTDKCPIYQMLSSCIRYLYHLNTSKQAHNIDMLHFNLSHLSPCVPPYPFLIVL